MDGLICLRALWDRIAAGAFILGGGLLVLDAGLQARDAVFVANSLSFLTSGGLGGLAALAFGCALLVSAGFHDEWRKLDRIEVALSSRSAAAAERSQGDTPEPPGPPARRVGPARWVRAESDRVAGWVLVLGAAVWLAVGARLVTSALYTPKQVAYVISGGLGAMVVLLLGLAVLLIADTRDEEGKLDRIDTALASTGITAFGAAGEDPAPRRRAIVVFGAVGLAVGAALVAVGWWKAADALRVEPALDGLVLASLGVGLVAAVLTAGGVRRRSRLALRARVVLARVVAPGTAVRAAEVHRNGSNGTRWTAAGLQRFHLAACPALAAIGPEDRTPVRVGSELEPCLLCDAGE